jgi:hypothetical protein
MAVFVLLHAALVTWAALHASRRVWAAISGPGFYVILVPLAAWVLWRRRQLRRARLAGGPQEREELDVARGAEDGRLGDAAHRPAARRRKR